MLFHMLIPLSVLFHQHTKRKQTGETKMVSVSYSHFVISVLVITLLCLRNCDAYSIRGFKTVADEASGNTIMMSANQHVNTKKEIVDVVPVAAEEGSDKLRGRKFMISRRQLRKEVKRAEETSKISKEASKNSGASSVGNSNHTLKRDMKMESKLSSRSVSHMKINPSGFMALNADYHIARTHPPKNN